MNKTPTGHDNSETWIIDQQQKKILEEMLLKQRLDKVTTQSMIVNAALQLAENLGWYIWGSRRFNLQKNDLSTDVNIFFQDTGAYDIFCKYLTYLGKQKTNTEKTYRSGHKDVPDWYKKVRREYFTVLDKEIVRRLKGQYTLDQMNIDVSCVEELLTLQQEVTQYAEKILAMQYDPEDRVVK